MKVIAIAGGSGSGKTTLARRLSKESLGGSLVLSLDSYHCVFSSSKELVTDRPECYQNDLFVRHLRCLLRGGRVPRVSYDFQRFTSVTEGEFIEPQNLIIIEGIFALYWPSLRQLYDYSIFLDVAAGVRLERRITRDKDERGIPDSVNRERWDAVVQPNYERFVHPTREYSSIVLPVSEAFSLGQVHFLKGGMEV